MRRSILTSLFAAALAFGTTSIARADDDGSDDPKPTHASTNHADPAAKTLPSHAAAKAQANAFGQQGARERAAHAAAKAAAVSASKGADERAAHASNAAANGKAHAQGPAAQAANGLATAAAARAAHSSHPGR
jgi:hypothetical protein